MGACGGPRSRRRSLGPLVCATRQLAGAGRESRDRAVVPSAAELVEQLKEIARLRAEGALTESEFEAVKARLLSDEASAQEAGPTPAMDEIHEPRTPHRSAPAFLARRHAAVASGHCFFRLAALVRDRGGGVSLLL